jgi:hypothetical protein
VLPNHTDRSGTTIHGLSSVAFGSLFAAVGITVGLLAWNGVFTASRGMPPWIGPLIGGMFAIAGFSFVAHGIAGVRVQRRVQRLRSTHTREPWIWDHPWNELGSRDDSGRRIGRAIWFTAFLGLFMVPFNWAGFFSPERSLPITIAAVLMDCGVIASVWWVVYLIGRRAKYGVSMLRFRRFPFRSGGEVELHLARPRGLAGVERPKAVLRCVQERYEKPRTGKSRARVVVAYEVWSTTRTAQFQRGEFVWRFDIPEGLPGTALSERPPRYWELELKVEVPGVDYGGTFLVPVYEGERRR